MGLFDAFDAAGTRRGMWAGINVNNQALGQIVPIADAAKQETFQQATNALQGGLYSLGQGYDTARAEYGAARDMYAPFAETGLRGFNLYADTLGANGQAGYDNAVASYRKSPGYDEMVRGATDAVARQQSATGSLASGNTLQAIADRGAHLANREFTGWQAGLAGLGNMGLQAIGQQAGLTKGLGDLATNYGTAQANLFGQSADRNIGAINNYTGTVGGAFANNAAQNSNLLLQGGRAQDAASGNLWGAMLGGANLLAGGLGRTGGLSNLFGGSRFTIDPNESWT
ncbi:hypothetical protein [Enterovirga sp. CN4-39]|uniref:hypothetical protein n=1 Tax=Enterovirga sp. CN4-39 TaxID=3400910 RepID=UPI003C05479F